jgi:hypothetical protein
VLQICQVSSEEMSLWNARDSYGLAEDSGDGSLRIRVNKWPPYNTAATLLAKLSYPAV